MRPQLPGWGRFSSPLVHQAHQARRAGRRSHPAGSGGLCQASRFFISSSSSLSHLRTASIRSMSVGAAGGPAFRLPRYLGNFPQAEHRETRSSSTPSISLRSRATICGSCRCTFARPILRGYWQGGRRASSFLTLNRARSDPIYSGRPASLDWRAWFRSTRTGLTAPADRQTGSR
jgi:hypothetical protein